MTTSTTINTSMDTTMKAIVLTRYGSPDVLQLKQVVKPMPGDRDILVKIHTSTVSATDSHFRRADPFITRFFNGLLRPRPNAIPGGSLAGVVEAVGKDVTLFKRGDHVLGVAMGGANAEYTCLPEEGVVVIKPAGLTYQQAIGIPEALTALYFLREIGRIQAGQKVLINGASGSIGTFAVQLAKYYGAEVTGVCSTKNVTLVKSLGADYVIDYTREDFTRSGQSYDIIFDTVGKTTFSRSKRALRPDGRYLQAAFGMGILLQMLWTSKFGRKKAILGFAGLNYTRENLQFLTSLVDAGTLRSVNDRCYPLEQIVEAHRYVDTGHKKGHVVITIAE